MIKEITIADFFDRNLPLIDVRSPGEYHQGHIPGAVNIPLFSDAERAHIGTVFTQLSPEKAVQLGYTYVNPKLEDFRAQAWRAAPRGVAGVHCWRGGLRSKAFADLLYHNGFREVLVISGGYKAYRNFALEFFKKPFNILVIGGYTGSGKTEIIRTLRETGHQVIDLEKLACHKGSAFGGLGQGIQPSTEQFENNLCQELLKLDPAKPLWVEDESHNIGGVNIPMGFFNQMKSGTLFFIDVPGSERAKFLVGEYARYDPELIGQAIDRISRRLGAEKTGQARELLATRDFGALALLILGYYDKVYRKGMRFHNPEKIYTVYSQTVDISFNAEKILRIRNELPGEYPE